MGTSGQLGECEGVDAVQFPLLFILGGEIDGFLAGYKLHVAHDSEHVIHDAIQLLLGAARQDLFNSNHSEIYFEVND